jgi:hypothetical protein
MISFVVFKILEFILSVNWNMMMMKYLNCMRLIMFFPDGSISVNNVGQEDIDTLTELVYNDTTDRNDPELHVNL